MGLKSGGDEVKAVGMPVGPHHDQPASHWSSIPTEVIRVLELDIAVGQLTRPSQHWRTRGDAAEAVLWPVSRHRPGMGQ